MFTKSLKNIFLLTGATVIGGLLNYAYHPLMLRFLSIEQFGEFESLISVFTFLGILTSGFMLFLNKEISQGDDPKRLLRLYSSSLLLFGGVGVVCYLIYAFFSPSLASYLQLADTGLVLLVGVAIIFSFVGMPMDATMRGLHKFADKSKVMAWTPLFKLLLGVGAVWMGYGIYGALGAFIATGVFSLALSWFLLGRYLRFDMSSVDLQTCVSDMWSMKKDVFHFFLASVAFALFMNADIIIAKNMFDPTDVGLYAGISVLAKFVLFLLLSIETVYYSQAMEAVKKKMPDALVITPILMALFATLLALGGTLLMGEMVLQLLDEKLLVLFDLLPLLVIYNGLLAVVSYLSKILVGMGLTGGNWYMLFVFCVLIVLLYTGELGGLEDFVALFVGAMSVLTVGLLAIWEWEK